MKVSICVEDDLMEQADAMARSLGLTRSGLVTEALRGYLAKGRRERITEALNRAYAAHPVTEDERSVMRKMRTKVTLSPDDRW